MPKQKPIANLKLRHVQMDPNYAKKTWELLRNAIHEIHKQNASGLSFEELYRNAYNMVLHKCGDLLYAGLREEVDAHLCSVAAEVAETRDEDFLQRVQQAWAYHKTSMLMIRDILMYMDRVYVTQNNVPSVYDLGLELFRRNVAENPQIRQRQRLILLELIRSERQGEVIDRSLLSSITHMLVDLGINSRAVYEAEFEVHFLETSAAFYTVESQRFINSNSCPDYMRKVEARLREEEERIEHYLNPFTEPKIREVVERELIAAHMRTLVEMEGSGLVPMLKEDKIEDLQRMYNLFSRVAGGRDLMCEVLCAHVRDVGTQIVQVPEEAITMQRQATGVFMPELIQMRDKYMRLLEQAFANDKIFTKSLNQAFEHFINLNPRSPEYISLFIDEKMCRGLSGASDEEVDQIVEKVMDIFRYVQEKDIFEKYYKQHLARRLLLGKSVSDDAELNVIQRLKMECGFQFTTKVEGMFKDISKSALTMEAFRGYLRRNRSPLGGIELNVQVLTTGFWPTQVATECLLPDDVQQCCKVFEQFYLSSHNGRRLTWQTNMGTADLKVAFEKKRHELSVSTYQMVILMLYRDHDYRTFQELKELTGVSPLDLKRNLLMLAKYKILVKIPRTRRVDDTDKFHFNTRFRHKLYRVKVMTMLPSKNETAHSQTLKKIDEDRKHHIEAAIVRTMKARKTLQHNLLLIEVTNQLKSRFTPHPAVVKKRIESLIERDYLERSKTDLKTYNYLA